jgi:hypothetical protein
MRAMKRDTVTRLLVVVALLLIGYASTDSSIVQPKPGFVAQLMTAPGLPGDVFGLALPDGRWLLVLALGICLVASAYSKGFLPSPLLFCVATLARTAGLIRRDGYEAWFHPVGTFLTEVVLVGLAIAPFVLAGVLLIYLRRKRKVS